MRWIVLGIMGRTPVAGVAWQVLHYIEGLRRLGHDVYYVEDTEAWPYNPLTATEDCGYILEYLDRLMTWCDFAERWAFCDVSQQGRVYGLSEIKLKEVLKEADAVLNLTGSTRLRETYAQVPVRVYLETDPGVPQIEVAQGKDFTINLLRAHTHHFTFAENFGKPGCHLPPGPFHYRATRQPIVLDWWENSDRSNLRKCHDNHHFPAMTTVSNWKQSNTIDWNGETYTWSKDEQFLKFVDLPTRSQQAFELALACNDSDTLALLQSHKWRILDANSLTSDIFPYRDYIVNSLGEFTVSKDQYVRLRTGWFSDRSACYLAAGRPVITQDTGFGDVIPIYNGLFAFNTMEDILESVHAINTDYEKHSEAARAIAQEYFKAETVLSQLIRDTEL